MKNLKKISLLVLLSLAGTQMAGTSTTDGKLVQRSKTFAKVWKTGQRLSLYSMGASFLTCVGVGLGSLIYKIGGHDSSMVNKLFVVSGGALVSTLFCPVIGLICREFRDMCEN